MSALRFLLILLLIFMIVMPQVFIPLVAFIVTVIVIAYCITRSRKETNKDNRYRRYLASDEWKAKRDTILKMAGYRCRSCGKRATQVHHETYRRQVFNEKLTDLTALCGSCHQRKHHN